MASTLIGRVEEYDSSREEWGQYVDRLGHFFAANGITKADKKWSVFFSLVGPVTYKLL